MTRDARLSALHRGGFSPGAALPSPSALAVLQRRAVAFGSVQRAPRSQVVVPGGRLPGPPGANGYEPPPQDATPRSARVSHKLLKQITLLEDGRGRPHSRLHSASGRRDEEGTPEPD